MSRIDLLINQIIERAQDTAEDLFKSFPSHLETGITLSHLSKEEFIKMRLEEIATHEKGIATDYNVRNIDYLRNVLFMNIDSRTWPITGTAKMRNPKPDNKMYCRKFHSVLWPLFVQAKRIDYLKGLIEPTEINYEFNKKRYSAEQLGEIHDILVKKKCIERARKDFINKFQGNTAQLIEWIDKPAEAFRFIDFMADRKVKVTELRNIFFRSDHTEWHDGNRTVTADSKLLDLIKGIKKK